MAKTGPNNARRVVWAIGRGFFLFSGIFLILNNVLLHEYVVDYKFGRA
jgi:hypothetical protein